eukprot:3280399-Amphidinium_carterae.1
MESTSNEEDAWAFVQKRVEGRSEEGQTPPSLAAAECQEMCGGGASPEETEDLMDGIPTHPPVPMLMTVQDGKPKLQ